MKDKRHLDLGNSIGVVAIIIALLAFVLTPPFWVKIAVLSLSAVGFFYFFLKSHWTHTWNRVAQLSCAFVLSLLIASIAAPQLKEQWEGKPYCYAIIYSSMGPDGSVVGGKEVLAVVEELKDQPAQNVTVVAVDTTKHSVEFDPATVRQDSLPVVYPYFSGTHSPCRFTPTHICYGPAQLGKEYWITISVGNGEDTQERIQFTKKGECISFMRLKDQKVYIKNFLSPFDFFGGCLMSPPQMANNPGSGTEWTTECEAN